MGKSEIIFGNKMSKKTIKSANSSKRKYVKKFGDDSNVDYKLAIEDNKYIGDSLGVKNIIIRREDNTPSTNGLNPINAGLDSGFDKEKGIIVGNIRMGFGHYRISMAIASAANALGYTPYWMDLNSYTQTTGGKVINAQNELYSLGSRISQKSKLFNRVVWEPMNYEGFRKISYNSSDQKNAELMTSVFKNVPKDIPLVGTHVWPSQAAVHAGMKYVVNAIPDNWPMALHLAEGSLHTVQTHSSLLGYRNLNGMNGKKILNTMTSKDICYTGHYIDYELVDNIEKDCEQRINRARNKKPVRFLLTIGGAGAQREIFASIIKYLLKAIKAGKACLYVNVGDYKNVWDELIAEIPEMKEYATEHFNNWEDTTTFANKALDENEEITGIHGFYHENIFEAVYCTNILMRSCDILVTKPSELSFYPVPKLFIKRVGGHEKWGAIHSAEIGDGTYECEDIPHTLQMIKMFINNRETIIEMCENIKANKKAEIYDGAIKVVKKAFELRDKAKKES